MSAQDERGFLARRRRARRLMFAVLAVGIVGSALASRLVGPIVGVGVYWVGVLGFVAIWQGTGVPLQDERERAIERWASAATLLVAAVGLVTLGPGLTVLDETGVYQVPRLVEGALLGYALLFGIFGLLYLARRYHR